MKRALLFFGLSSAIALFAWSQNSNQNNFGGGGSLPTGLTYVAPTLTVSVAGSGNAVLALSGNTSGTCTSTVNGTSTTVTENCVHLGPDGSVTAPTYAFSSSTNSGMFRSAVSLVFDNGGINNLLLANAIIRAQNTGVIGWSSGDPNVSATDTGSSRSAAGVIAFGNQTSGNTTSKLKASGYMSLGTKFTTSAGCGESAGTIAGGASTGTIGTVGSTSCTTIVTLGDTATAPTGWACQVQDVTTAADRNNPTYTSTATTVTIVTGTIVSGDTILLGPCVGY